MICMHSSTRDGSLMVFFPMLLVALAGLCFSAR